MSQQLFTIILVTIAYLLFVPPAAPASEELSRSSVEVHESTIPQLASVPIATEIESDLNRFFEHTAEFMNEPPKKIYHSRRAFGDRSEAASMETRLPLLDLRPELGARALDNLPDSLIEIKDRYRRRILEQSTSTGAHGFNDEFQTHEDLGSRDRVQRFLRVQRILQSLEEMEGRNLMSGRLPENPWSGSYWPTYMGLSGARYGDPAFPRNTKWSTNFNYISLYPAIPIFSQADRDRISRLSPAEKYDLLISNQSTSLTSLMWDEGRYYYNRFGSVEEWFGLCHGWAPASFMTHRPAHRIQVLGADGRTGIDFYPEDIKALATQLWSYGKFSTSAIGTRCNAKNPATDANGRIIAPECFDTNPGVWHLAVVNQIGYFRRNMIFDIHYDYEVWNQPVHSYSYVYFNPQTRKASQSINEAMISPQEFTNDKFRTYRSSEATRIVGIALTATYLTVRDPVRQEQDTPNADTYASVKLYYDLELDSRGAIIGGEWYQNLHPDFLWAPVSNVRAGTPGDREIANDPLWDGRSPLPSHWIRAAQQSARQKMPLAKIVESLTRLSQ